MENTHEPLVDQATFDTVQERIKVKKPVNWPSPVNIFRGLLFCGECNTRLVFSSTRRWSGYHRKSAGWYCCNKYRRYGSKECSGHNISIEAVSEVVLEDIRRHAAFAAADKERYVEHLVCLSERKLNGEQMSWHRELENCQRRLSELDTIIRRLYENSVFGRISTERYASMSASYEDETSRLKARSMEIQSMMDSYSMQSRNASEFAKLVAQYTDITCLTEELLNTLIEKIVVHEKEEVDDETVMRLDIYYRFIGKTGGSEEGDLKSKKRH